MAVKGSLTLNIFAGRISYDFGLSEAVLSRRRNTKTFGKAEMIYAAPEDIFILKLIANRPRDFEDCSVMAAAGLDYEAIYSEIEAQYHKAADSEVEQKVWITYIEEGIGRLEEDYRLRILLQTCFLSWLMGIDKFVSCIHSGTT